jgi:hypothetical protein
MLRPNRRSHTFGVPKSKKAPLPHPQALTSQVESYWLPRLHTRGVARAMAMGKEKVQWWFIAIPFSSGCRSHSSVDVVHARVARCVAPCPIEGLFFVLDASRCFMYRSMEQIVACSSGEGKVAGGMAAPGVQEPVAKGRHCILSLEKNLHVETYRFLQGSRP